MPSTSNEKNTSGQARPEGKKKLNAAEAPLPRLEAYFKTDLRNGLSPKAAADRLAARDPESLFQSPPPGVRDCIKEVLREPVMWLFVVLCVVALFFQRADIGLWSLLLMLGYNAACVLLKYKALHLTFSLQARDVPMSRVIRNGRLLRVRGDRLVPGDVVLLRKGDMVPADGRLITTRRFSVLETTLQGDQRRRVSLILEKDAGAVDETARHDHSPAHMVYAGSVVQGGYAKALVVAVSSRTHLGGLTTVMPSPHAAAPTAFSEQLRGVLSKLNLILAVSVIPLTAVGILTRGHHYGFLDVFLSVLALAVISLTEQTLLLMGYHDTAAALTALEDPDRDNAVDIRTPRAMETLGRMDHLILVGTAALHDGTPHPRYAATCGRVYPLDHPPQDQSAVRLAEKLQLLTIGQAERLRKGLYGYFPSLESLSKRLCEWASVDEEALLLRLNQAEAQGDAVEVSLGSDAPLTLYLVEDPRYVETCGAAVGEEGMIPMAEAFPSFWQGFIQQAYEKGFRIQFLISDNAAGRILEGAVLFAVEGCRKTRGCIDDLALRGVRVVSFLRDHLREDAKLLSELGLTRDTPSVDLAADANADMARLSEDSVQSFVNATTRHVLDYIEAVRKRGGCVGVLSAEAVDRPLLEAGDMAFSCMPTALTDTLEDDIPRVSGAHGAEPDGLPDSDTSDDLSRRQAQVLLRRCGPHGGGVCGVRRALLATGQLTRGLAMSFRFILLSSVLRVLVVLLPLLAGQACVPAPIILLSGFVMDLLAVICYTRCDLPEKDPRPLWTQRPDVKAYLRAQRPEMILTAVSCVIPFAVTLVTRLAEGSARGDMAYFCALSLLLTQLAVYFMADIPKRHHRGFWMGILMVCVYVAALAIALTSGLHVLWCLLLPLAQSILWIIGRLILGAVEKSKKT